MKILLDSCVYIWIITSNKAKINDKIRELFLSEENEFYVSIISQWELTIKNMSGKFNLKLPIVDYYTKLREEYKIKLLNIDPEDINTLTKLPQIHNDPFDRMMISQAINNGFYIMTPDEKIHKYPVKIIW